MDIIVTAGLLRYQEDEVRTQRMVWKRDEAWAWPYSSLCENPKKIDPNGVPGWIYKIPKKQLLLVRCEGTAVNKETGRYPRVEVIPVAVSGPMWVPGSLDGECVDEVRVKLSDTHHPLPDTPAPWSFQVRGTDRVRGLLGRGSDYHPLADGLYHGSMEFQMDYPRPRGRWHVDGGRVVLTGHVKILSGTVEVWPEGGPTHLHWQSREMSTGVGVWPLPEGLALRSPYGGNFIGYSLVPGAVARPITMDEVWDAAAPPQPHFILPAAEAAVLAMHDDLVTRYQCCASDDDVEAGRRLDEFVEANPIIEEICAAQEAGRDIVDKHGSILRYGIRAGGEDGYRTPRPRVGMT